MERDAEVSAARLLSLDLLAWRSPVTEPGRAPDVEPVVAEDLEPAVVDLEPTPYVDPSPGRLADPGGAWCVPGVTGTAGAAAAAALPARELSLLRGAVDMVASRPVSGRAADLALVLELAERVRGLALRQLGELDATGGHADDGRATASAWLKHQQLLGDDASRSAVLLARRLRGELAVLGQALVDGATTVEHVKAAAAGTAGLDPELVAQAQPAIAALLTVVEPAVVRRQLRERAHAICPQLGRDAARRQHARRGLYASQLAGAGVVLGGSVDDEGGAELLLGLDLQVEADRTDGDTRGLPARRLDAVLGWARRAAAEIGGAGDSLANDAHTVRSHLLMSCTVEHLRAAADAGTGAQLDALEVLTGRTPVVPPALPTGAALLPEQLRRLACDTTLSLVLAQLPEDATGPGGWPVPRVEPLYVGRSARTISGLQFKALVARDRHCVVKGCDARPARCAGHHVRHWLDGGLTDLDNLVLLCHKHHHDHHDRGYDLPHTDGRWLTQTGWGTDPP